MSEFSAGSPLLRRYASDLEEMRAVRDGSALRRAAESVIEQLREEGAVLLLGGSIEGVALAAAAAALRDEETSWQWLELARPRELPPDLTPVAIEPVDHGEGLRTTIARAYPTIRFLTPQSETLRLAA